MLAAWTLALAAGAAAQTTGGQTAAAQSAAARAQAAAPASQAAAPQAAASPQAAPARPAPAGAAGRRDPFRPLVVKGQTDELPARLPPGKAGLVIGQLTVQGIVRGLNGEWIAVVDNKTKRAFFLFVGDELYNGTVSRITVDTVVFDERVMDAQGRMVTREVVKRLNPS
jgi:hypothetical protein